MGVRRKLRKGRLFLSIPKFTEIELKAVLRKEIYYGFEVLNRMLRMFLKNISKHRDCIAPVAKNIPGGSPEQHLATSPKPGLHAGEGYGEATVLWFKRPVELQLKVQSNSL